MSVAAAVVPISSIAEIARGGSPRPIKKFITDDANGVNWIKIGDTKKGGRFITSTRQKIRRDGIKRSRWVDEGDFLLSNSMSFGRPYILKISGCIHDGWLVLKPDYSRVDQGFLYYALGSPQCVRQLDGLAAGSTVRNLNIGLVSGVTIPLPSLEEQKRIVAILDQVFAALDRARTHAEANLADAQELFLRVASANLDTVAGSGQLVPIGGIAEHCLGKMLDKHKNKGVLRPYLRNLNVRWFEVHTSDVLEMKIEESERERYSVRRGDLLVCEGGYPGRASIYDSDDCIYFQKALHRVRFADSALAKILMYWLFVQDQTGKLKTRFTGTGISHFTGKALSRFPMPVSHEEANAVCVRNIEKCWEQTSALESEYRRKLADIADLRQSILQKAFAGELN